jgi:hypothetical protein
MPVSIISIKDQHLLMAYLKLCPHPSASIPSKVEELKKPSLFSSSQSMSIWLLFIRGAHAGQRMKSTRAFITRNLSVRGYI